jgi:hypothetical protein
MTSSSTDSNPAAKNTQATFAKRYQIDRLLLAFRFPQARFPDTFYDVEEQAGTTSWNALVALLDTLRSDLAQPIISEVIVSKIPTSNTSLPNWPIYY